VNRRTRRLCNPEVARLSDPALEARLHRRPYGPDTIFPHDAAGRRRRHDAVLDLVSTQIAARDELPEFEGGAVCLVIAPVPRRGQFGAFRVERPARA